ncbi:claudin-7-like [Stigmatopora nigra]
MGKIVLELSGFFLSLMGLVASLICTVLPFWEVSVMDNKTLKSFSRMRGLWMECIPMVDGLFTCKAFGAILDLPNYVQVSRILMVISLALSTFGLVLAVIGMKCTVWMQGFKSSKRRMVGSAGCFVLVAGFLTLVSVSWSAHRVISTYFTPRRPGVLKLELGECIYLGIFAELASIMGGSLLVSSFCQWKECRGRRDDFPYVVTNYPHVTKDVVPLAYPSHVQQMESPVRIERAETLPRSSVWSYKAVKPTIESIYV